MRDQLDQAPERENWSSGLGFILAAAGSAVGLGNIWKFPYITGENGGGAFVVVYLICVVVISVPVMLCEMLLGRHTRRSPVGAFKCLAPQNSFLAQFTGLGVALCGVAMLCFRAWGWGCVALLIGLAVLRYRWRLLGALGVLTGFIILSFYGVVGGWTIGYIGKALSGGLSFNSIEAAQSSFSSFITNPLYAIACHFLFMGLCIMIVFRGIQSGIERWSKILMPLLLILLIALVLRGLTLPGALEGVRFYLSPDFSKINSNSILTALGMAFFSLSLGMGVLITYGSYVGRHENLFTATMAVAGLDTLVSLLAGLAIFPALFAMGFEPNLGPGLVFQVLPTVFNHIPLGAFWALIFFLLLLVAALTSGISLLEVVTAYFIDEHQWSRKRATIVFGTIIFVLGCGCALSVDGWARLAWLEGGLKHLFGQVPPSFFDTLDQIASNWMLPLGGLFISLFVGWTWGTSKALEELRHGAANFADAPLGSLLAGLKDDPQLRSHSHLTLATYWGIFIRFVSPTAILIAFLHNIGWLKL